MLTFLKLTFIFLIVYGIVIGAFGGSMLALLSLAMLHYADRMYAAQDAHPSNAKPAQAPTSDALREQECECIRSRF